MPSGSCGAAGKLLVRFECFAGGVTPPTERNWHYNHEDEQHSDPEPTEDGG
jgi:hypothetical protein